MKALFVCVICALGLCACRPAPEKSGAAAASNSIQTFSVTGLVREVHMAGNRVVVRHKEVPNYMPAMTMPFHTKQSQELSGVQAGDQIAFRLNVKEDESWIDSLRVLLKGSLTNTGPTAPTSDTNSPAPLARSNDYSFTNERGQEVNLADFSGKALALTFIFTRCPIPEYCPRLSKNFAEASQKLLSRTNGPTNFHFLSITIDPEFDTPQVLKAYGDRYRYNSNHWSFLTGPSDRIQNMQKMFGFESTPDPATGLFNHGFRTVVINVSNQVQQVFPFSGNLSDDIAKEMLKAMGVTNGF